MSTNALRIIDDALESVAKESAQQPDHNGLSSVLRQLQYLHNVLEGKDKDLASLTRLSIGATTTRMIQDDLPALAKKLFDADYIGRAMRDAYLKKATGIDG